MTDLLLIGPASVDRYVATNEQLPGGGALNMAYHWAEAGREFQLISRVSSDDEPIFGPFLSRHGIAATEAMFSDGPSCSVDIVFHDDRQPWMDNFVEGIWSAFALSPPETAAIRAASMTHLVLVDVVDAELRRCAADRQLDGSVLSGDFLSFRHFTPERFAASFSLLDIGFIGWPGRPDDAEIEPLVAQVHDNVLVLTFGSQGVRVVDGRGAAVSDRWFDIEPVEVLGTTVGCGDAFVAAFLGTWADTDGAIDRSVDAGCRAGAGATRWTRPLPDAAYDAN